MQSLTLPRNALILRQELCELPLKGAVERVPASKLKCSFSSRYFMVLKRDGGLCPILHLRPINRALCKRPFGTILLEQILAQICPGTGCVRGLKDAYFHIQIGLHHMLFLRFSLEGTAHQYPVLLLELALAPRTFSKCMDTALSPPQSERDARSHCRMNGGS